MTEMHVQQGLDDETRQMVVDTVRQLRKKLFTREKVLEFDEKEIFPEASIRELLSPEIGLQLLFIPEEYGGMGGGATDCCIITRELSEICLGVSTAFFAIQLGSDPILVGATDEQKSIWLGKIAEGDSLVAYAVTEPGAGSNVAGIKTKADPISDDSGKTTSYRINGTKQFISNGGYADILTVLAKTPEGPSFFVVEKGMPGFSPGKAEIKHGIRASNTSALSFDDLIVPAENLIGGVPGQGLKQANKVFGYTRLMVASMATGAARAAHRIAVNYARERVQFGVTLSEFQGYTHKLFVPHWVRMQAAENFIHETAKRLDRTGEDLQVEGAIAKVFATESANKAVDAAIQALGGYGYVTEFEVEKIKRDVRITTIYEGTSEILQNIISTFRWKSTRKSKGEFYRQMSEKMKALHGQTPEIGAGIYALAADSLNEAIMFVNDNKLTREQHIMFQIAEMATYVEIGVLLAEKTAELISSNDAAANQYTLIARLFADDTARLVTEKVRRICIDTGVLQNDECNTFLERIGYQKLVYRTLPVFNDMNRIADIIFERRPA